MLFKRQNSTSTPKPYIVPPSGHFDGNDGKWSTFMINVGSPGQNFRVLASTAGSTTWVPLPEGCSSSDPQDCPDQRGVEIFAGAQSKGYDTSQSSASKLIGIYKMSLGSTDLNASYGEQYSNHSAKYGYDTIGLGPASEDSLMLSPEVVGGLVDKEFFLGTFGLALTANNFGTGALPSFLSLLPNSSYAPIPSLSYGYAAGASYRDNYTGSLILGGYDRSRFKPSQTTYDMPSGDKDSLTVAVQSITIDSDGNSVSATLDTNNFAHLFSASIDSTLPYLWLPRAVCDRFEQVFGLSYDESTELYLVNSTSRQRNLNSTINFKVAQSQTANNYSLIEFPYAAFDLNATWPIYPNATSYFPIRRAPNDVFTLGRTFLQEAYLTVDYGRKTFSLAQAKFDNSREDIVAITNSESSSSKSTGLSTGALVGIIVGAVVVLLLLAGLAFCLFRRRRAKKDRLSLKSTSRETSEIPQTGRWTFQPSPSNHGSVEWQGSSQDRHSSNATSNGRGDTISPMMSSNASTEAAWPLPNNWELPAAQHSRPTKHGNGSVELPSTESSSAQSLAPRDRPGEVPPVRFHDTSAEKPVRVLSGVSEMSCDTEIYELESPRVTNNPHSTAEGYRNLLTPPPEEEIQH